MHSKYKTGFGLLVIGSVGVIALLGSATVGLSAASARYCRPVVPEMVITFPGKEVSVLDGEPLAMYFEDAGEPFVGQDSPPNSRFSFCRLNAEACLGQRARYEVRWESDRFQGLQIRDNGAFGRSTNNEKGVIGNLRWEGPSYPHRIEVSCDLSDLNPNTACEITRLINDYSDYTDEFGASNSLVSSHDQCSPDVIWGE